MLLAILMDTYTEVKQKSLSSETLVEQVAEMYRRWRQRLDGKRVSIPYIQSCVRAWVDELPDRREGRLDIPTMERVVVGITSKQALNILGKSASLYLEGVEPAINLQDAMNQVGKIHTNVLLYFKDKPKPVHVPRNRQGSGISPGVGHKQMNGSIGYPLAGGRGMGGFGQHSPYFPQQNPGLQNRQVSDTMSEGGTSINSADKGFGVIEGSTILGRARSFRDGQGAAQRGRAMGLAAVDPAPRLAEENTASTLLEAARMRVMQTQWLNGADYHRRSLAALLEVTMVACTEPEMVYSLYLASRKWASTVGGAIPVLPQRSTVALMGTIDPGLPIEPSAEAVEAASSGGVFCPCVSDKLATPPPQPQQGFALRRPMREL